MVKIFISYAHLDKEYKDQLEKHLAVLKRNGEIAPWTDKMLVGGETWDQSIIDALNDAELIICLVSSDFLSSDYCYEIEMKGALKRHEDREAIVVPIILRPCDWTSTPFAGLQALPMTGRPIKDWGDQDEAFLNVVEGLKKSIHTIRRRRSGEAEHEHTHTQPVAHESADYGGGNGGRGNSGHHYTEHAPAGETGKRSQLRFALMGAAASLVIALVFFIAFNSHSKSSAGVPPIAKDSMSADAQSASAGMGAKGTGCAPSCDSSKMKNGKATVTAAPTKAAQSGGCD